MSAVNIASTLDSLLDPLSRCLDLRSAQRITELKLDKSVRARIKSLAEKANEGALNDDERAEYEAAINAADFIAILKLKARRIATGRVQKAIDEMSPSEREVLIRGLLWEQTLEEISGQMGLTTAQVRVLKHRAKMRFAERVRQKPPANPSPKRTASGLRPQGSES